MTKHLKARNHFKKVDPLIFSAMEDVNFDDWMKARKERTSGLDYFRALCREIIGQQLSGKAASAIIKRFNALFNESGVSPDELLKKVWVVHEVFNHVVIGVIYVVTSCLYVLQSCYKCLTVVYIVYICFIYLCYVFL